MKYISRSHHPIIVPSLTHCSHSPTTKNAHCAIRKKPSQLQTKLESSPKKTYRRSSLQYAMTWTRGIISSIDPPRHAQSKSTKLTTYKSYRVNTLHYALNITTSPPPTHIWIVSFGSFKYSRGLCN